MVELARLVTVAFLETELETVPEVSVAVVVGAPPDLAEVGFVTKTPELLADERVELAADEAVLVVLLLVAELRPELCCATGGGGATWRRWWKRPGDAEASVTRSPRVTALSCIVVVALVVPSGVFSLSQPGRELLSPISFFL